MTPILVAGLINMETTLRVDGFPIPYFPVRYPFGGVHETVSGVGYNLAKALTRLGADVKFLSLIGHDLAEQQIRCELLNDQIAADFVLPTLAETARSVILYDSDGRRQINVDLKDIQEQIYPPDPFEQALAACELAALCNINFARPMLPAARKAGKIIATDVHTVGDLHDGYNRDFMQAADILFMSDEALPDTPENWAKQVQQTDGTEIVVIGLGASGSLLAVRSHGFMERIPAVQTRLVVNTIGAGDALFAAFLHTYVQTRNPYDAIQKATLFASYKIGETGAAQGFLTGDELENLWQKMK